MSRLSEFCELRSVLDMYLMVPFTAHFASEKGINLALQQYNIIELNYNNKFSSIS